MTASTHARAPSRTVSPTIGSLSRVPPVEIARMTNAAARLFEVYQSACLTLLKRKAKGRQRVVVQYQQVNVGGGGHAVVAGRVGRASRSRK